MKEISREKRLEIARCYLLGYSYAEIEAETGASHGTVANIVQELERGKLVIPGTPFDQVNDLRALSLDLKKKKLQPSQALLGLALFQRIQPLEITPEHLDGWSGLLKEFARPDCSPRDFLKAALRLHDLEKSQGKPFDTLAEEYMKLGEDVGKLKEEVYSLGKNKAELVGKVGHLNSQVQSLEKTRSDLKEDVAKETARLQELKLKLQEATVAKSQLTKEAKDLESKRAKLSSQVDGKEESLKKLNDIGLSAEDLVRLTAFIGKTSKNEGISGNQVKERFFSALAIFEDVAGLEKQRKAEAKAVGELVKKQSVLGGEIFQLEKRKGVLEGEIGDTVSAISHKITEIGANAASHLEQRVADMKAQLDSLLADVLKTGAAIGEMKAMQEKGEQSSRELEDFMKEVKSGLEER